MSNLVAFKSAGLPAVTSLAASLRSIAPPEASGSAILKMDRTGHWVFGADQDEVETGSSWAVNPFAFVHGWIAWGDGEVLGEQMASVSDPLPDTGAAPAGAKKGWEQQVGMSLKCISGEDKGLEVRYSSTCVGGKRGIQTLAVAIAAQVDTDPTMPVPVVTLGKEFYMHKSFGKIYTPLFDVQSWIGMNGEDEAPEPEPAAPARRRRS
jgi:hypothetical protein